GSDIIDGGAGNDVASYASAPSAVTVNLSTGTTTGGAGVDTLSNVEGATGSNFNDTFVGNSGNNTFSGGSGTDTVNYSSAAAGVTVSLGDRKSTRLNSSHEWISYAVFC